MLPMTAILLVLLLVVDTVITLIRRALRRERVWRAHCEHLYQRLVRAGWTHAAVSTLYGLIAIAITGAVVYIFMDGSTHFLMPVVIAAIATLVLVVVYSWRARTDQNDNA